MEERIKRWRLILGNCDNDDLLNQIPLNDEENLIDQALSAIYDNTNESLDKTGGKGPSNFVVTRWLTDVRKLFKEDIVSIIQTDAIERKGLKQLLFEPELLKTMQPDINLATTLLSLRGLIPEKTKDTARMVVREVVDEINRRLYNDIRKAVIGVLNRKNHSIIPNINNIDWKYTINKNIKHFNKDLKVIVPERFYFFENTKKANQQTIIIDMDQSGSMGESIIYASVMSAILASIKAIKTRIVAFDTEIIDLTERYGNDPLEMLFGIQLGGGTDINKSVSYCRQFITEPKKTLYILLTDLYEGGNEAALVRQLSELKESGVTVVCLLAISDQGKPSYNENLAQKIAKNGIPSFACTPNLLPDLLEAAIKGNNLAEFIK